MHRSTLPPAPARLRVVLLLTALLAALALPLVTAHPAAADTQLCNGDATLAVNNGEYIVQANEWNSSLSQCLTYTSGTAWQVSTANFNLPTNGAPATYPSIYKGCHWGLCTTGSGLPIQISKLATATSSWSTTQPASGAYDVAYDLWTNSTPTTTGQPNGTEIMIWLNSRGGVQPFGSQTATTSVAGHNWNVWTGQQTSWKIISYVLQGGGTAFTDLDIKALLADAQARGSLNSSDYLLDAEAGFEIWQGGQGLATNSFSFSATASGTGTGDTQAPTTPANLKVTATTSSSASLSWSAATDNVGVAGYRVYRGGTQVGSTTGTSYTDTGLSPATAYSYTVAAYDSAGNTSAPSGAVTATTASSGGGGNPGCTATLAVTSQWTPGFTDTVTVTAGSAAIRGWTVTWTWPNGQQVTSAWNAALNQSGAAVTASNLSYNGALSAGAATTFGFQGTWSGTNGTPALSCSAN